MNRITELTAKEARERLDNGEYNKYEMILVACIAGEDHTYAQLYPEERDMLIGLGYIVKPHGAIYKISW